jgi:hypothetical protein
MAGSAVSGVSNIYCISRQWQNDVHQFLWVAATGLGKELFRLLSQR